jgi:hypothetical protein
VQQYLDCITREADLNGKFVREEDELVIYGESGRA